MAIIFFGWHVAAFTAFFVLVATSLPTLSAVRIGFNAFFPARLPLRDMHSAVRRDDAHQRPTGSQLR